MNQKESFDAGSWIGRSALVPSATAVPLPDGTYAGEALLDSTTATAIAFTAADGTVVHSEHIAGPVVGRVAFRWDGLVNGGPVSDPLQLSLVGAEPLASIAVWTTVEGVLAPAQSAPMIQTRLGAFAPVEVLDLK